MAQENQGSDVESNTFYRLQQLHSRRLGNMPVADLEGLVTHHPHSNAAARIDQGQVVGAENPAARAHGVIGGEIQEIEIRRTDRGFANALGEHQVLLVKDFILEDSRIDAGDRSARRVDVPSPVAGVVGSINQRMGGVEILDREGGEVIARVLHMDPVHVVAGQSIAYGQALGIQHMKGLHEGTGKHVHVEIDTRYYQQFGQYIEDLASRRLGIDPKRHVAGIEPRAVVDDGIVRIGQSGETVRLVQQRLNGLGYRDADGQTLEEDGTYRLSMQAAVIRYQQAEGLPVSGDIDRALQRNLIPQIFPPSLRDEDGTRSSPELPFVRSNAPDSAQQIQSEPLLDQARRHAASLDLPDMQPAASERFAARMACLARQSGLTAIDHIVLSRESGAVRSGEYVFVVQGALQDPMHMRARMCTDDAMNAPLAESIQALARDNRRDIVDITQDVPQRQAPTQSRV